MSQTDLCASTSRWNNGHTQSQEPSILWPYGRSGSCHTAPPWDLLSSPLSLGWGQPFVATQLRGGTPSDPISWQPLSRAAEGTLFFHSWVMRICLGPILGASAPGVTGWSWE